MLTYPFDATITIDHTQLIRLMGNNIPLKRGDQIKVYEEEGYLGTVSVTEGGQRSSGGLPAAHYSPSNLHP